MMMAIIFQFGDFWYVKLILKYDLT